MILSGLGKGARVREAVPKIQTVVSTQWAIHFAPPLGLVCR